MKILVMSDSHGNKDTMLELAGSESPDMILHLGDHARDCELLTFDYPKIPLRSVVGNCDRGYAGLEIDEFVLGGKRFFMTHGHLYGVKSGLGAIINTAMCRGADVLLFGHTHIQYYARSEGLDIINPGSVGIGQKKYAVLKIKDGAVSCELN